MADVLDQTPELVTQTDVAQRLLTPLWRCIDDCYKSRYAREIWTHYENAIRSAGYTSSMPKFLEIFTRRIPCTIQGKYAEQINSIVASGHDETILDWLRQQTTYMVLLVRLDNDRRRAELAAMDADARKPLPGGKFENTDTSDLDF